jgi:tetratricopeptide (TPR) repeat protein
MSRRKPGKSAVRKQAFNFDELFTMARSNFDLSRFDKAGSYFEKALARAIANKDNEAVALTYFGWTISLAQQGRLDDALRLIGEARARFGGYLDSHFLEVMAHHSAGNLTEANQACIAYFEKYDVSDTRRICGARLTIISIFSGWLPISPGRRPNSSARSNTRNGPWRSIRKTSTGASFTPATSAKTARSRPASRSSMRG